MFSKTDVFKENNRIVVSFFKSSKRMVRLLWPTKKETKNDRFSYRFHNPTHVRFTIWYLSYVVFLSQN